MGARRRVPVPETVTSPLRSAQPLPRVERIEVLEAHIAIPMPPRSQEREAIEDVIRDKAVEALEDALDDLRLLGASEQQLGAIMGATRLACLMRLLDEDLEEVMAHYLETCGKSRTVTQAVAAVLMPELAALL